MALQILDVLKEYGVDTVFGIPGGAISRIYGELVHRPEIRVVNATHETNAMFLAMGYARATGKPAVVLTTAGPGFTNAITGLASAMADGLPVLLISGEVPRSSFGRGALQEGSSYGYDSVAMARPITKTSMQLARPTAAVTTMRKAMATMLSGKQGPAFISLPLDVSNADVTQQTYAGSPSVAFRIDADACRAAADLLSAARRPLLLVGAGARSPESRAAIVELARSQRIPVAVTPKGKSVFPEDDELYLGVIGFGGHESVIDYLNQKPDVVLVAGSSLNDFATNAWTPLLTGSTAFIQIDVDAGQLGKNYPVDVGILGPIKDVVGEMLLHSSSVVVREKHPRLAFQPVPKSATGALTTSEAVMVMNEVCPKDSMFTSDMGEHLSVALHFLRTRTPGAFTTCLGFGSMGSGVVSAIGMALGDSAPGGKKRRAFAICGDGGFLMSGNELQSAVMHKAPVTFVIMNDARYNMCHHGIKNLYGATPSCNLGGVDFAKVAEGFGAVGKVARTVHDLTQALKQMPDGPVVIDVRVDPDARLDGSQREASLRQFQEKK